MLGTPDFRVSQPTQLGHTTPNLLNSRDPAEGAVALEYVIDWTDTPTYDVDLTMQLQSGAISGVQTMYIDNAGNDVAVSVTMGGSAQLIVVPAGAQMYVPILAPMPANLHFDATGSSDTNGYVALLNVPMPFAIWYPYDVHTTGAAVNGDDFSANQQALAASLIATVPVNAARKGYSIQNQSAQDVQVSLDDGTGVDDTIYILATGGGANTQGGALSYATAPHQGRIRVFSSSAASQVAVREW